MPLEFRGLAIMNPKGTEVRFAGYPTVGQSRPIVICQVTTGALRLLGKISEDATQDDLMDIFEAHKDTICEVASTLFDKGAHRPVVTPGDLPCQPV